MVFRRTFAFSLFLNKHLIILSCDRRPDEDSDSDFRDSSSDGSSDCELERRLKCIQEQHSRNNLSSDICRGIDRISLGDNPVSLHDDFSSDEGESGNSQASLIFEYLERDPPYSREPLADKVRECNHLFLCCCVKKRYNSRLPHFEPYELVVFADIGSCISFS